MTLATHDPPDAPAVNEVARADFEFRIEADAEPAGDVLDALAALLVDVADTRKENDAESHD